MKEREEEEMRKIPKLEVKLDIKRVKRLIEEGEERK